MLTFDLYDLAHNTRGTMHGSFNAAMRVAGLGFLVVDRRTNIGYIGV